MKHTLYTSADFTEEEAERRDPTYVHVVEHGLDICKMCGQAESDLAVPCLKQAFVAADLSESEIKAINDCPQAKSISDDDLCATCTHCAYVPGEMSLCKRTFPDAFPCYSDDSDTVVVCAAYLRLQPFNSSDDKTVREMVADLKVSKEKLTEVGGRLHGNGYDSFCRKRHISSAEANLALAIKNLEESLLKQDPLDY